MTGALRFVDHASVGARLTCEVLVIGSGAGGATTAALLAEAGIDVVVVEEGRHVEQGSQVQFSVAQMEAQYRNGGVTAALGLPSIAYAEGCTVGGSTEINSGLYRRPPEELLLRWQREHGIEDLDLTEIGAIADEVEAAISVSRLPGPPTGASERLARGAAACGWSCDESPRWMQYLPDGTSRRQSMTRTYLPRAVAAGARVLAETRVDRIAVDGGRARRADITRRVDGRDVPGSIWFRDVVVAGGAIQTPALLQRSGIRRNIGNTLSMHPTVKLAARFGEPLNVPDDVPVHQVKEFAPALSFGGSASGPGMVALSMSDNWDAFGGHSTDWRSIAVYYAAITSQGKGRVRALPGMRDPLVTYHLTPRDRQLLRSGLARLTHLLLAAGAEEVYPGFRHAPVVRRPDDVAAMAGSFAATKATVMTVHLCATVPMGGDERTSATDSHGRVWGTSNVWVNDASLLPDAPGVNPQGTVMALATRNTRRYLDRRHTRG